MDEKRVNYFTLMYKSVSDINFCSYLEKQSIGSAFLYLLIVTLILGTLSMIRPVYDWNTGVMKLLNSYRNEIPDFELKNGILDVKSSGPIIMDENGSNVVIIDTKGQTDERVLDKYREGIFISRDKMIQKKNNYTTTTTNFSDLRELTITKQSVENWLPTMKLGSFFIIFFGPIWFFISKLFSLFVISALGEILCGISRFKIKYGTIIKLSFYAITAPIILKLIVNAAGLEIPFFAVPYYVLGAVYIWLAGRSFNRESRRLSGF